MEKSTGSDKIKYFVYTRKSTEGEERQALSIQSQRDKATEFFGNLDILETFEERKSAFTPDNRVVFENMMKRIEKGEAQGIIAWHPDRLSRNEVDGARITYAIRKGVLKDIKFGSYSFDNSPEGIMMLQMALSQSQYSSAKLSKDVKRGLEKKLSLGWIPCSAPLGYLNTKTQLRGENYILKDEERFNLVRKAWDLMLTGNHTPPKILDMLNNEWGFRTRKTKRTGGKPMSYSTIYKVFTNQFYAGLIPYNEKIYQGHHEPMVTLEEFDRVQVILGREGKPRPKTHEFAFTGCIRCAECGCLITAIEKIKFIKRDKKNKTYVFYHCTRRKNSIKCTQRKELPLDNLELQIEMELEKYTILPEFRDWALEILNEKNDTEIEDRTKIYEAQQKDLTTTQTELDELTRMRYRGLIDDDFFKTEKTALQNKIIRLKSQVKDTEKRAESWLELSERTFNFALYARKAFVRGSLADKREILTALGENPLLNAGILNVYAYKWLERIEKDYPELEAEFEALELTKTPINSVRNEALTSIRTRWRGRPDLNRRSSP